MDHMIRLLRQPVSLVRVFRSVANVMSMFYMLLCVLRKSDSVTASDESCSHKEAVIVNDPDYHHGTVGHFNF